MSVGLHLGRRLHGRRRLGARRERGRGFFFGRERFEFQDPRPAEFDVTIAKLHAFKIFPEIVVAVDEAEGF